ncbi:ABC1-domain-containing protein [Jaminaea rosea]|uniref:ABC1-domain-containing protein n=1 Tax=Jaminaea rosea TaxID=1569628 RepID=A0A316UTB9_9BASI|nr:ABC1-domain-containing protein [Jaminaea rosea]PWN26335.1 ABC1-domain-containing protein [Jaminaea rosea]
MRASRVPSSRIARLMHYGSLGAGLAWGAAGSFLSPSAKPTPPPTGEASPGATPPPAAASMGMSPSNVRRLVDKLSRMRGAALKLGQFLSIQDADLLPKEIEEVLRQVQSSANYMPEYQLEGVMRAELGAEWRNHFSRFDVKPFAAASIGQVHYAMLSETHPEVPGMEVAVKVQFPGIKESIESDLGYLRWLLAASALLPRGLFLDKTIQQMRMELNDECDYEREAEMGRRFGQIFNTPGQDTKSTSSSSKAGTRFEVPRIIPSLCTSRVLTTQMMKGRPLSMVSHLSQPRRDALASQLLHLCLSELFTHRLMQTDPNFSNFLYEPRTRSLQLIDFGATREYGRDFMDKWLRLLLAAVGGEEEECRHWSLEVGYLLRDKESGECLESDAMVAAHVRSMILLGSPFRSKTSTAVDARYDFTTHSTLTDAIKAEIPLMLRERKTPPPKETYSLNRKLSGTFLLCSKLRAKVDCAQVLRDVVEGYRFEDGGVLRAREDGAGGWTWQVVKDAVSGGASGSTSSPSGSRGLHTSARLSRGKSGSDKSGPSSYIAVADRPRGPRKWERE